MYHKNILGMTILMIFDTTSCSYECSYHTAHSACMCTRVVPCLLMKMNEIFARHGPSDKVVSDNSSQFDHAEFA